jgi:MFS family permease
LLPETSAALVPAYAILAIIKGAFIVLPWVLLAERLPLNRFATLGVGFVFVGGVWGSLPAPLLVSLTLDVWGLEGPAFVLISLSLLAATLAWRFPRPALETHA